MPAMEAGVPTCRRTSIAESPDNDRAQPTVPVYAFG